MAGHEKVFQNAFINGLQKNGWAYSGSEGCPEYDRGLAIIPSDLQKYLTSTQKKEWKTLVRKVEGNERNALKLVIEKITKIRKLANGGTYNLLLKGVKVRGVHFILFHPKPATAGNTTADMLYSNMIMRVVSELYYSETKPRDSIDLAFFISGIPVGTAELKSPISGQGVGEAETQYREDRQPGKEMLLNPSAGALFHIAGATDRASLTTALRGDDTRFIPFNTGIDNTEYARLNGSNYATSYLWDEVLSKDSLSLIVFGMMRNVVDNGVPQTRFPRYHQLDNLRKIIEAVQTLNGRKNYLSQHAPGSGKSDEIANLAYALSKAHDEYGNETYSSIVVITNRTVLDDQIKELLQNKAKEIFYSIDKKNSTSKSADLSKKLLSKSPPRIISVTAQTFGEALVSAMREKSSIEKRSYAIIVDEAHDGETGKQHQNMYRALLGEAIDNGDLSDTKPDEGTSSADTAKPIAVSNTEREHLPTLNFFAYTATPSGDTLRVFGEKKVDAAGNIRYEPFHTYSMRQAREEGYINDVLANYVTHERYVKIEIDNVSYQGDEIVDFKKGNKEVRNWMKSDPEGKEQIAEIIIKKMKDIVLPSLRGKGKAMVVCSSREEVLAFKHLIDAHVKGVSEKDKFDTLAAFSGTLYDPKIDDDISENDSRFNTGLEGRDIATAFKDDNFRLLIVADKYQVGFDQPQLVCMFINKPLKDIKLVQTTARVNRKIPGKENVYIFDFINDKETVIESFRKFDKEATLSLDLDLSPDTLDSILRKSADFEIHENTDIEDFRKVYESTNLESDEASARMSNIIDTCSARFRNMFINEDGTLVEDKANEYKVLLKQFQSIYNLLSITRSDVNAIRAIFTKYGTEARFFGLLSKSLAVSGRVDLGSSVDVNALRLSKLSIIPQSPIGSLTQGEFKEETGNYSDEVSGITASSLFGPVEVLIERINDYPEIDSSRDSIRDVVERIAADMKNNSEISKMAESNGEKSFSESKYVHESISRTLSRLSRNKASEDTEKTAKALLNKQDSDNTILIDIAQALYRFFAEKIS